MDSRAYMLRVSIAILCILVQASTHFPLCDAKNHGRGLEGHRIHRRSSIRHWKRLKSVHRLDNYLPMGYSNFDSYGSPSSLPLPPFNSLAPVPQPAPETATSPASPYPPYTPPFSTPASGGTIPTLPAYSPNPNSPHYVFGPPSPSTSSIASPPPSYGFGPPSPSTSSMASPPPPYELSPPKHGPNPPKSVPSPPLVYLPPVVFPPPPSSTPPRHKRPEYAVWCVAKPTVPDPIIQEAMNYACGSGADCKSIQLNGPCYQPNTLLAHASYAFNSYWQNTKIGGGTCDFGGTAILVTVDPSYDRCNFILT